jgi:type III secretion protein U
MSGEKNLPATEKRIEKAREDGQVASSQDLMRSAVCLSVFEGCRILLGHYYQFAALYLHEFISQLSSVRESQGFNANNVFVWIIGSAAVSLMLGSVAVVVWIAASWVQTTGPVFKKHPIELKLDKLDPTKVFKNVFSAKTAVDFISNILKASLVAIIFGLAVRNAIREAPMAIPGGIEGIGFLIGRELLSAVRTALVALLALAVVDFGIQRRLLMRDLKMSFQEQRDEQKEMMGNPEVKQQIRQVGHEVLSGNRAAPDPLAESNALIVNPTHLAVGLRYVKGENRLPQIRIKAADAEAMDLIELAQDRKVPVVRHIWLARTLYELAEGEVIPREAFKAVAAVYRMLIQLDQAFASDTTGAAATAVPEAAEPDQVPSPSNSGSGVSSASAGAGAADGSGDASLKPPS